MNIFKNIFLKKITVYAIIILLNLNNRGLKLIDTQSLARELFSESVTADISYIMQETFQKINKKEVREDLFLDNCGIATAASNSNWARIGQYIKDKNLGDVKKTSNNKKRWFANGLTLTINKVDEKLKPSKLYIDDFCQTKLPFPNIVLDISIDNPLVIGYIPSKRRDYIKAIHIIKYKNDGSLDWNFPIYESQKNALFSASSEIRKSDIKSRIKIKIPDKKVVELFDRN